MSTRASESWFPVDLHFIELLGAWKCAFSILGPSCPWEQLLVPVGSVMSNEV